MFEAYKKYADFQGRAGRSEYWLFVLCNFILTIIALVVDRIVFSSDPSSPLGRYGPATIIVMLANLIPGLAVGFRRLHDTNRSAWWTLIAFIPLVGSIVLLVFYCLGGTQGPNRFGPGPGAAQGDLQATFS